MAENRSGGVEEIEERRAEIRSAEHEDGSIDILMVTYNRPAYTRRSLRRLLATCDDSMRVWIWHNGDDEATLKIVNEYRAHPRVHRFHHSHENKKLHDPNNWFWSNATGTFLSIVADDSLMPDGWGQSLRQALVDVSDLGVVACWHFREEDFDYELAAPKLSRFPGGITFFRTAGFRGAVV